MFRIALNTSTLRNWDLSLEEKIDITARAGYTGFEPWLSELIDFRENGGKLKDICNRLSDRGLTVVGAIGFIDWAASEGTARRSAHEQAKQEMEMVSEIGGNRMAAPPSGKIGDPSLEELGDRFGAYLDAVSGTGVTPDLELWGFCKRLFNMSELLYVASAVRGRAVTVLLDTYQLYKGGGPLEPLALLNGRSLGGFHANDYPASPPRTVIADPDRIFPGDGIAPLRFIYRMLRRIGYEGFLSLELFRKDYGSDNPLEVARTGYEKTLESMEKAFG